VARLVCENKRVAIGSRGRAAPKWTSARRKCEEKATRCEARRRALEIGDRRLNIIEAEVRLGGVQSGEQVKLEARWRRVANVVEDGPAGLSLGDCLTGNARRWNSVGIESAVEGAVA